MRRRPFYHILVRRVEHLPGKPNWKYETNLRRTQMIDNFLIPYLSKENVIFCGYIFPHSEITAIKIFETANRLEFVKNDDWEHDRVVHQQGKDVTTEILGKAKEIMSGRSISVSDPTNDDALRWFEKFSTKFRTMSKLLERRRKGKPSFEVQDEYDFQDLLQCFLSIEFNDVRTEEWTPQYAGGNAKMDFLLPEFRVAIETKFVTDTRDTKRTNNRHRKVLRTS